MRKCFSLLPPGAHNAKSQQCLSTALRSLLLDTYVKDKDECRKLLRGIHTVPCVARKAEWALRWVSAQLSDLTLLTLCLEPPTATPLRWIQDSTCFAERLIAFACVEGIHFSGR